MPIIYVPIWPGDKAENVAQQSYVNRLRWDAPFGSRFPMYVGKEVLSDKAGNKIECMAFEVSGEMTKTPGEKEQTLHHFLEYDKPKDEPKKPEKKK